MDWLMDLAKSKGIEFEEQAARLLIDHTGTDLLSLSLELDKLQDYKNDTSPITIDHIRNVTGLTKDSSVFSLQDALGHKDLEKSLRISNQLLESGENINLVLGVLFSFFKRLIQVQELNINGLDRRQIAETLRLRDFQVRDLMEVLKFYETDQLEKVILYLANTDNDIKTSRSDDKSALLMLCYNICRT
jgi:DNA polymerase-3 subunit delta